MAQMLPRLLAVLWLVAKRGQVRAYNADAELQTCRGPDQVLLCSGATPPHALTRRVGTQISVAPQQTIPICHWCRAVLFSSDITTCAVL